jgi:hypothetical protein
VQTSRRQQWKRSATARGCISKRGRHTGHPPPPPPLLLLPPLAEDGDDSGNGDGGDDDDDDANDDGDTATNAAPRSVLFSGHTNCCGSP